ncbi:UDP-2,4-diacetamido-2,4,6-trideoxy-beta-L-altropyranose hydrolase [Hydrogenibacillus schlegelii]|uniref:UDP-2,4-diacetamido-2,4, 6-trideoxy-beta-L-altropyranose hydrolase n=1 Tax=Hydrogenibacillus schlegelii TaxID=1484 RepID=UPI0009E7CEFE|nr:UDP-2,4-diacetamido-2,4,6-trideoxy-beta-L-altropyranose hydrolase [Hydrogenibacillus schlegelii]
MFIIRVDASPMIGTGHAMRMLGLTQWLKTSGQEVHIIAHTLPESIEARYAEVGVSVTRIPTAIGGFDDALITAGIAKEHGAEWIILDGYGFTPEYQRVLKEKGFKLLLMDDYAHLPYYVADVIVNQNLFAERLNYRCESPCRLLLGSRYVLLRKEFWRWRHLDRKFSFQVRKLLLTMGGSDSQNLTSKVLQVIKQIDGSLEINVVIGASNSYLDIIQELTREVEKWGHRVRIKIDVNNMPALMAASDIAITAGGTTVWELAFMGIPMLVMATQENQLMVSQAVHEAGIGYYLCEHTTISDAFIKKIIHKIMRSPLLRLEMGMKGRKLIDGYGVERIAAVLQNRSFFIRNVHWNDAVLLWKWANDRSIRSSSLNPEPVSWENHIEWFNSKMADRNYIMWMVMNQQDQPMGLVRFNIVGSEAVISVLLDPKYQGRGLGPQIIQYASRLLITKKRVDCIHAYIKPDNEKSNRAFKKAGYKYLGVTSIDGKTTDHFVYS